MHKIQAALPPSGMYVLMEGIVGSALADLTHPIRAGVPGSHVL
ncbi:hypothetical protein [Edaphobacter bradus]|nr:hypothetical protein [Edaphobacter bradus]